ncbi:MAG: sigma-70 family RNA polymerase sigma factor [Lentisphaeraceae bacterium]|nr:sigma-70 family RNA polymerase sigma factor [Lentisphaeraceae bacterium]
MERHITNEWKDTIKPDLKILKNASRGCNKAAEVVYQQYADFISNSVMRIVKDSEEARDVTQKTFIIAFQKLPSLQELQAFPAWLKRIGVNQALASLRHKKVKPTSAFAEDELDGLRCSKSQPLQELKQKEIEQHIKSCINELPREFQEVFVMAVFEKISYQEIADLQNISLSLVKLRVHRSRLLLRDKLNKYYIEGE